MVVCGKGNNGGDGLVAARVLRGRGRACARGRARAGCRPSGVLRVRWRAPTSWSTRCSAPGSAARSKATPRGWSTRWPSRACLVVAVDIPSGVDGLTGAVRGRRGARRLDTVTFAARKPGLLFEPGRTHAGEVAVADIGIDLEPDGAQSPDARSLDECRRRADPAPACCRPRTSGRRGVMVVGGSGGMTGAPMFASHAAMRAGAGIVWCCGLPVRDAARHASGAEVITRALPVADGDHLARRRSTRCLLTSRSLRCGGARSRARGADRVLVAPSCELVARVPVPLVLDADGLNALDGDLAPLVVRVVGRRASRCSRRTTASTPASPASRSAPTGSRPRGRLADRLGRRRAAQGPDHGGRRADRAGNRSTRDRRSSSTSPARRRSPAPAPATCSPGSSRRSWLGASSAFEAAAAAAWVHGARPRELARARASSRVTSSPPSPLRWLAAWRINRRTASPTSYQRPEELQCRVTTGEHDHDQRRRHPVAGPDRARGRRRARASTGSVPRRWSTDGKIIGLLRDEDLIVSEANLHVPTVDRVPRRRHRLAAARRSARRPSSRRRRVPPSAR